jgi:epoxyqueuosine reductase
VGAQAHIPATVGVDGEMDVQVGGRQKALGFVGPLTNLQATACKNVSETRVFPFTRIVEAVKVKMPDAQALTVGCHFIRLHHRISGAFDAILHAQGLKQITREGGFACPQVALQTHQGLRQGGAQSQALGKGRAGLLVGPVQGFYNRHFVQKVFVSINPSALLAQLQEWGLQLGFSQIGVAPVDLRDAEPGLLAWLALGHHGDMAYMARHGLTRARPAELVPGTLSVITARMDYLPQKSDVSNVDWVDHEMQRLQQPTQAVVSVYARGRDYHKVMRQRLQQLADKLQGQAGALGFRVFTDSAPVLEAELAVRSGLGWRGKHTLVLQRDAGSFFFLGEIFVDIALEPTTMQTEHCGTCSACISVCPTLAIVAPYRLDARRCISYLTIEHEGSIPLELRPMMGNRIYGCDDCQLVCPWNKFAKRSPLPDFDERHGLGASSLWQLLQWDEDSFLRLTEGSAIRRIGHARWLRNLAVAAGNALRQTLSDLEANALRQALQRWQDHPSEVVREHIAWALS